MLGKGVSKSYFPNVDDVGIELDGSQLELVDNTILLRHTLASGNHGGGSTNGAWRTCPLNAEYDPNAWCTLAANQFTLVAGTYRVHWVKQFNKSADGCTRIYNVTDTAVEVTGLGSKSTTGDSAFDICTGFGVFTLAAGKTLRLEYQVQNTRAADGLGIALGWGEEVYTIIMLERLK